MATNDKTEDEILGIEILDSSIELITDIKADEDLSFIDEEMLLLDSPSPVAHVPKKKTKSSTSSKPKSRRKPAVSTSLVRKINDNDDELEIIDDDVEEINDDNIISGSDDAELNEDDELIEDDELNEDDEINEDDELDEDEEDEMMSDESELESEESNSFLDGKINIFYCHGSFFLWNTDDVQMLREECRIVGKLTGSLPRAPRQNNLLGLPLQLMPEEVKLLIDIDAAVVIEEEPVSDKTKSIREAAFQNVRATNFKIQQNLFKESRKEDVKQRMGDIIAGKQAKKRKPKKDSKTDQVPISATGDMPDFENAEKKMKTTTCKNGDDEDVTEKKDGDDKKENDSVDQLTVEDIISETADTSEKHSLVQLFTENPWKRNFRPCASWVYPSTEREWLRYLVFKDLWGKGFYLTSGSKFGGDFLTYPGDPARFHSQYIAICKSQTEKLSSLDIITYGRQASNVRKTALLCSLDKNRKVFCTSLQWTGLS